MQLIFFRPYYEMKAHFNQLLDQQKIKVQNLEAQVMNAKYTYADALRNLEQISDEIHQTRSKAAAINNHVSATKQTSIDSNDSFLEDIQDYAGDYKQLPDKLCDASSSVYSKLEEVDGYKNVSLTNGDSPVSPKSERIENPSVAQSHSSEWTEINLDVSSPEEDSDSKRGEARNGGIKPKLLKQKTLPNPAIENEFSSLKSKIKLDASISNWISRSSAKTDVNCFNNSK